MDAPTPVPMPPAAPGAPVAGAPYAAPAPVGVAPAAVAPLEVAPAGIAPAWAPTAPAWAPPVSAPQNVLAWVSFGLGLGSLMFGLLASIPAVVCGHIARRQIRERGDQGASAALIGLIFGYVMSGLYLAGFALYVLFIVVMLGAAATSESGMTSSL